ncbi:MAG: hypothetical protein ABFC90_07370 [Bacteroidales bacterium]|nr:hypothetical protein [Bacteroidales bacterium]
MARLIKVKDRRTGEYRNATKEEEKEIRELIESSSPIQHERRSIDSNSETFIETRIKTFNHK